MSDPPHHAAMFVPYPFRPFWQPNSRSTSPSAVYQDLPQHQRLCEKLDTAEKKIIEYAQLIASLSADLKRYQDTICHPCKEKIFRSATAPSSQHIFPASENLSQPIVVASDHPVRIGVTSSAQTVTRPPSPTFNSFSLAAHDQISESATFIPQTAVPMTISERPQLPVQPISETPTITGLNRPDWSVEYNPEIEQTLSLHVVKTFEFTTKVYCARFSRDGKFLAVGLHNGEIHIYNMTTESHSILLEGSATVFYTDAARRQPGLWAVRFSPDNKYIAVGDSQGRINLWEIARKRIRARFKHKDLVRSFDFSPDGRFLVSASFDNSACMWRVRDGSKKMLWHGASHFVSVAFSPNGRSVATGDEDGLLRIWDARTGRLVAECMVPLTHNGSMTLRSTVFMPDGKGIGCGNNALRCWDVSWLAGRPSRSQDDTRNQMNQIFETKGHTRSITAISFSPDNLWVLSGSLDCTVCISDAQTGSWVCTLKGHTNDVWAADFSPAGHHLVSGAEDRLVRLWRYEYL